MTEPSPGLSYPCVLRYMRHIHSLSPPNSQNDPQLKIRRLRLITCPANNFTSKSVPESTPNSVLVRYHHHTHTCTHTHTHTHTGAHIHAHACTRNQVSPICFIRTRPPADWPQLGLGSRPAQRAGEGESHVDRVPFIAPPPRPGLSSAT